MLFGRSSTARSSMNGRCLACGDYCHLHSVKMSKIADGLNGLVIVHNVECEFGDYISLI